MVCTVLWCGIVEVEWNDTMQNVRFNDLHVQRWILCISGKRNRQCKWFGGGRDVSHFKYNCNVFSDSHMHEWYQSLLSGHNWSSSPFYGEASSSIELAPSFRTVTSLVQLMYSQEVHLPADAWNVKDDKIYWQKEVPAVLDILAIGQLWLWSCNVHSSTKQIVIALSQYTRMTKTPHVKCPLHQVGPQIWRSVKQQLTVTHWTHIFE